MMAILQDAFNEGHFRGNVQELKYAELVGKRAQSDRKNSQNSECQYHDLVIERLGEVRAILVFSGLCLCSVKFDSYPFWM